MTGLEEEEEELDSSGFVEVDPTGRYGRYNEILGKGASKTVYKGFDEYEGIEVAWNQVKLYDFLQSPEDLERLYCEIHLLKTLKHENIMKFYTSWVDTTNRNINFVTEMFTSGTLRQYRLKHRRVNVRAVKHWCRQILKGLLYLHSHYPPIIHRDLKCDNIFVNGNQGEVKIGDLGLAAILRKSHAARCVGTPEFMAPEVYQEEYNELVDIYSFGMCVLEMVTFEYPYSECTHPAQIYKKVVSGKKPAALYKVKDLEVRQFVEKCLATVSSRLSARELLMDPFLQVDDFASDLVPLSYLKDAEGVGPLIRQPQFEVNYSDYAVLDGFSCHVGYDPQNEHESHHVELRRNEIDLFACEVDEYLANLDISIKGHSEDNGIFLRLRIADKEGRIRNIYFPFDIEIDTALSVATEMVSELDITDQDAFKIADMIDGEIATLVPEWRRGYVSWDSLHQSNADFSHNCSSQGYPLDYVASDSPAAQNVQVIHCSKPGCSHADGRFEEITYQVGGPEKCEDTGCLAGASSQSYADICARRDTPESSLEGLRDIHCDEGHDSDGQVIYDKDEKIVTMDSLCKSNARSSFSSTLSAKCSHWDDYENEIRQELRWLKAKYQMQLRELMDQQLRGESKSSNLNLHPDNAENKRKNEVMLPLLLPKPNRQNSQLVHGEQVTSFSYTNTDIRCSSSAGQMVGSPEANGSCGPHQMSTTKIFYGEVLLPHSLHRATSLPVDAIDV